VLAPPCALTRPFVATHAAAQTDSAFSQEMTMSTLSADSTSSGNLHSFANFFHATNARQLFGATASLLLLGAISIRAHAQNVTFAGAQITVGSGLNNPQGVTLDGVGNAYIADTANNRVVKVSLAAGTQTTVGTGLNSPISIALDAAGDVFIADFGNSRIEEVTPSGVQTTVPASGLKNPRGVAVDAAGDVFIADSENNRVLEVTPSGVQTEVGSGFSFPGGLAFDAAGNLYVADIGNDRVEEITPSGVQSTVPATDLALPTALAFDTAGDLFIADYSHGRIEELTPSGVQTTVPAIGLTFPQGVAVDAAGDVFIGDSDNNRIAELQRFVVNFGSVSVCSAGQIPSASCNAALTLTYTLAANMTFGPTKVLTRNFPNLDFTLATGSTCKGFVRAGTCTVNITFTPLSLGLRSGVVKLVDPSNNVLVTVPIHGFGVAQ
jgi:sugar lactone lactonase YvrE